MPYEFCAIDKEGFKDWIKKNITPETFQVALCAMVDSVVSLTAKVSTRGEWIEASDGDGVVCSNCKTDFCTLTNETEHFLFCPYCGAKMDLEE